MTTTAPTLRLDASPAGSVALVADREIRMRLRSKAFLISTGILLLGRARARSCSAASSRDTVGADTKVAVVGGSRSSREITASTGDRPSDRAAAEQLVRDGDVEAAIVPADRRHRASRLIALRLERPTPLVASCSACARRCRAARPDATGPGPRLHRGARVRPRVLHVGHHLRHDDRAERRRGEADPGGRDPDVGDSGACPARRQGDRQQRAGVRADRGDRRRRHRSDSWSPARRVLLGGLGDHRCSGSWSSSLVGLRAARRAVRRERPRWSPGRRTSARSPRP